MADDKTSDLPKGPEQVDVESPTNSAKARPGNLLAGGDASRDRSWLGWLLGALAVWAIIIAAGAYLYGYRADARKPLIVAATMGVFLLSWALMMRRRSHSAA